MSLELVSHHRKKTIGHAPRLSQPEDRNRKSTAAEFGEPNRESHRRGLGASPIQSLSQSSPPEHSAAPSGLTNGDCNITAMVKHRWKFCGYMALEMIECLCEDGVVIIRGTVHSFYDKQVAQESIRCIDGIRRIVNEIAVRERKVTDTNG